MPEFKSIFEKVRPVISITIFIILVIGVGFLSVNFLLALVAKLSELL